MKKFVATSLALCMSLTPFTAYAGKNDAKNSEIRFFAVHIMSMMWNKRVVIII